MTHEPECPLATHKWQTCYCEIIRAAYRRGYNDHASSRAKAEAMYGTYTQEGK